MRRRLVGLREPHRKIDRGVVRHIEKQNLCGAEQERGLDTRRMHRQPALDEQADEMAQASEPAQHGADQCARQRPVALFKRRQCAATGVRLVKQFIEPAALPQHALDDIRSSEARGEAGSVLSGLVMFLGRILGRTSHSCS